MEKGAVASRGGRIAFAGPQNELPRSRLDRAQKIVDCEGRWITETRSFRRERREARVQPDRLDFVRLGLNTYRIETPESPSRRTFGPPGARLLNRAVSINQVFKQFVLRLSLSELEVDLKRVRNGQQGSSEF